MSSMSAFADQICREVLSERELGGNHGRVSMVKLWLLEFVRLRPTAYERRPSADPSTNLPCFLHPTWAPEQRLVCDLLAFGTVNYLKNYYYYFF